MADELTIYHRDAGREMTTTRHLYETVWARSGWVDKKPRIRKASGSSTGESTRKKGDKPETKE